MTFPLSVNATIPGYSETYKRMITLNSGLTVILGANGSGKTQLLRGLIGDIAKYSADRKVRFISAGRIGSIETYRSNYDGHRTNSIMYDQANFGSKSDIERRHINETLNGDFQTLSQRPDIQVKIQERLKKLFRRDLIVDWDGGNLNVRFARLEAGAKPYSSGREASGLLHLIGILTALYDDEVGSLLIDEPEVSLHPQLQAFLAKEIRLVAGLPQEGPTKKLVVIATHSTEMLHITKPSDLSNLVFCYDVKENPIQLAPSTDELQGKKIKALVARLGQEHKLSLFCKRPLLVEGPSDVIICTAIAAKMDMHLEAAGSQLLPVVGKGQMPVTRKLLQLLGKQPVILVDADAIADGMELISDVLFENTVADARASINGFPTALRMAKTIFSDFCDFVDVEWTALRSMAETHPYWINRSAEDEKQAKRRAAFCTLFINSDAQLVTLDNRQVWLGMKSRLSALLVLLESADCFVLRRGSIESYYQSSDQLTSQEKPSAAAVEMEYIDQLEPAQIQDHYADIARCIVFAADTLPINESESIRNILLSVVAPILAGLHSNAQGDELKILAQSLVGDKAKLFEFKVSQDILEVSLSSKILSVPGMPFRLVIGDNVIDKVNEALGL
ncbi:ATP-dependent nuclease [Pseudomonas sp. CT11-2]|uniref:ATP-dependent nuclease n=1 Tax=unclassified Pseudomonas TaxID=196821 RepID=UPI00215E184E|nr:AAA family ATPase [Pseudomonas sp. B21-019]UVM31408.1 AAA family ATPase [Pseudomonas sp. B21-019]